MSLSQTIVLILGGCGPMGGKVYAGSQRIQTAGGTLSSYERVHSTFDAFHFHTHFLFLRSQRRWGEGARVPAEIGCNAEITCHKSPAHQSDQRTNMRLTCVLLGGGL